MEVAIPTSSSQVVIYALLFFGIAGIITAVGLLGFLTQNVDNTADIKAKLGGIAAGCSVAVILFGIAAYIYFSINKAYMTSFILIMTFINLLLSLFAVSAASIGITSA